METSVSVIIPFFNEVSWLIEAVESVIAQTYKAKEIIVVNDGSKENIDDFLHKYDDKIIYIYKENGGPATARNLGIEKSTGDYIAFLDSDDIWLPKKLEVQIGLMEKTKSIWSHTSYETFDTNVIESNTIKKITVKNFDGMIYPKMLMSNNIATPCIVIKGDILRSNTKLRFNNDMRYGQDQYLWINVATEFEILAIDKVLTRVRVRGNNAALRAIVQLKARAIIWQVLNNNKAKFRVNEISRISKLAFYLSNLGMKVVSFFEKYIENKIILENIARVMYMLPWLIFKINYYKLR